MSRWLQAPLYMGLIVAQALYVWQFWHELVGLVQKMTTQDISETQIMLIVLGLIDVVMISNPGLTSTKKSLLKSVSWRMSVF